MFNHWSNPISLLIIRLYNVLIKTIMSYLRLFFLCQLPWRGEKRKCIYQIKYNVLRCCVIMSKCHVVKVLNYRYIKNEIPLVGCKKKLMRKIYWFNGFKLFDLNSDFLCMPLLEPALMTSNACQDLKAQCIY